MDGTDPVVDSGADTKLELPLDNIFCVWSMGTNYGYLSRYVELLSQSTAAHQMMFSYAEADAGTQNIVVECSNAISSQNLTTSFLHRPILAPFLSWYHLYSTGDPNYQFQPSFHPSQPPGLHPLHLISTHQFHSCRPSVSHWFYGRFKTLVPTSNPVFTPVNHHDHACSTND